jgi:hypothetical protein
MPILKEWEQSHACSGPPYMISEKHQDGNGVGDNNKHANSDAMKQSILLFIDDKPTYQAHHYTFK